MNTSCLSYNGIVTVKQYKKNRLKKIKVLKNEGTARLFYLICMLLYGEVVDSTQVPSHLDIIYQNTAGGFNSALSFKPIIEKVLPTPPENLNSTEKCYITYSTTLTSAYVRGTPGIAAGSTLQFALIDGTADGNILARVDTEDLGADWSIAPDEVYIITWRLEIGNDLSSDQTASNKSLSVKKATNKKVSKNAK